MEYRIQPGDTITSVTKRLGTDWDTLKKTHPEAVGKSAKTGDWIVKAGKTVSAPSVFQQLLDQQTAGQAAVQPVAPAPSSPEETVHILQKGETIWDLARKKYHVDPNEIIRLNKIGNPNRLRAGQPLRIPAGESSTRKTSSKTIVAGWYGEYHQGRLMANGRPFDMHDATIAHRHIPIGTEVELENPKTGEKAKAVVTDRGPYQRGRDVDLSYGLAERLSITRQGVGNLRMRVL